MLFEDGHVPLAECDCSVQESIKEDLRKLKGFQDDFCHKGPGCFKRVRHTNVFVFQRGTHLACSWVLYSMFEAALNISSSVHECLEVCAAAADTHLNLEPFCRDNHNLLKYYENKGLDDKRTELKRCEKLSRNKIPLQYSTGGGDLYLDGYQMSENVWTERLKGCLDHFLPTGFTSRFNN